MNKASQNCDDELCMATSGVLGPRNSSGRDISSENVPLVADQYRHQVLVPTPKIPPLAIESKGKTPEGYRMDIPSYQDTIRSSNRSQFATANNLKQNKRVSPESSDEQLSFEENAELLSIFKKDGNVQYKNLKRNITPSSIEINSKLNFLSTNDAADDPESVKMEKVNRNSRCELNQETVSKQAWAYHVKQQRLKHDSLRGAKRLFHIVSKMGTSCPWMKSADSEEMLELVRSGIDEFRSDLFNYKCFLLADSDKSCYSIVKKKSENTKKNIASGLGDILFHVLMLEMMCRREFEFSPSEPWQLMSEKVEKRTPYMKEWGDGSEARTSEDAKRMWQIGKEKEQENCAYVISCNDNNCVALVLGGKRWICKAWALVTNATFGGPSSFCTNDLSKVTISFALGVAAGYTLTLYSKKRK